MFRIDSRIKCNVKMASCTESTAGNYQGEEITRVYSHVI